MKTLLSTIILLITFNIKAQEWQILEGSDMPLPVYGGKAVVIDSLIYIIGGFSDSLNSNVNVIQEFNPQTYTWRIMDTMSTSRYGLFAGNYQNNIIIAGGIDSAHFLDSSIEIWNPNSFASIRGYSLDFVRKHPTGVIHNNSLFIFGGVAVNPFSTYMFEYNIPDSSFVFRTNFDFLLSYPTQQMSAYTSNSIYLFGGAFPGTRKSIYHYDVVNRTLNLLKTELTQSRSGGIALTITNTDSDTSIYLIGGFNESMSSLASVEIFENIDGEYFINAGPTLNYERSELMAAKYNNFIYVFGGKNDLNKPVRQTEILDLTPATNIVDQNNSTPENFILYPNYPNPFNPSTNINFYLPANSQVQLTIYNITGEEIIKLVDREMQQGDHNILFDFTNEGIPELSSGIYFYGLTAFNISTQNTYIATRKMLLLK